MHHKLYTPWLKPENCKAGLIGLRGTVNPAFGLMERHAKEIAALIKEAGVHKMPVGVDIIEPPMLFELEKAGLKIKDGQQVMLEARELKNIDEIALLNRAAAMVDGAYHLINEELKPGVRENDIVGKVNEFLYRHGSDDVEAINAISGERCNPHPHNFTDRMLRPGDQAFFDILQSFMGYRTCYYRTFNVGRATPVQHDAYKKAREWLDKAIALIKPGITTDKICKVWPKAPDFGFPDEMSAFGLQFGHGLGLALHERPIISRVVSLDHPTEIKEGMVFALETYCPATDGYSAARIEEEVVVTDKGCRVITLFPAEELPISHPVLILVKASRTVPSEGGNMRVVLLAALALVVAPARIEARCTRLPSRPARLSTPPPTRSRCPGEPTIRRRSPVRRMPGKPSNSTRIGADTSPRFSAR